MHRESPTPSKRRSSDKDEISLHGKSIFFDEGAWSPEEPDKLEVFKRRLEDLGIGVLFAVALHDCDYVVRAEKTEKKQTQDNPQIKPTPNQSKGGSKRGKQLQEAAQKAASGQASAASNSDAFKDYVILTPQYLRQLLISHEIKQNAQVCKAPGGDDGSEKPASARRPLRHLYKHAIKRDGVIKTYYCEISGIPDWFRAVPGCSSDEEDEEKRRVKEVKRTQREADHDPNQKKKTDKGFYCSTCSQKFVDYDEHLDSAGHRKRALDLGKAQMAKREGPWANPAFVPKV